MDVIRNIFSGHVQDKVESPSGLYQITYCSSKDVLPSIPLNKWNTNVILATTGPNAGISHLDLHSVDEIAEHETIAGIDNWNSPSDKCFGRSVSLYEEITTQNNGSESLVRSPERLKHVGDPIADVYASVVRGNNTIMVIADGCGWGRKPRLAARCAVRTSIEYILNKTKEFNNRPSSEKLMNILSSAMEASQQCICNHKATITTLSIAIACETMKGSWGVFTLSLGDSRVFVYCPRYRTLMETSVGSHPSSGIRSNQDSGGALGPAIGELPDLENLSFSYVLVAPGDFVLLTTDGITDNFVPQKSSTEDDESSSITLNIETRFTVPSHTGNSIIDPCCEFSSEMHRAIHEHHDSLKNNISAQTIALFLLNKVFEKTEAKRQYNLNYCHKKNYDGQLYGTEMTKKIKMPGKLDHATILSYQVG